ncbi:hypothetical protein MUN88_16335 [Gracilibacillus caseinilyticus]|uniref:Uncharacterized protein n=1 Tax=Gracilibacillus caseinilyticus TaxID=2932256 RepID=A0ABY4ETE6_9BACI|nr:hypothetical protein [Gracilibacillus caseinilyticus]UOQ47610.1 hypothetical protein MUN88_16335 [Gracilibacillus caseinilyticus]
MKNNHVVVKKETCERKMEHLIDIIDRIEQEWNTRPANRENSPHWPFNLQYKQEGA